MLQLEASPKHIHKKAYLIIYENKIDCVQRLTGKSVGQGGVACPELINNCHAF